MHSMHKITSLKTAVFFLNMVQSHDKWKLSCIGFHDLENFWPSEISTRLEISIKWIYQIFPS